MREGEAVILTYSSATDKMMVFSAFIREGLESGDAVWYSYPDEESETVRAKLKEHGIDVEKYEKNGALYLESEIEGFMSNGKMDYNKAVVDGLNWWAESKRKGYKHIRDIEDVGDFSFVNGQWQKYITEYWLDPRWEDPNVSDWVKSREPVGVVYDPLLMEITAINVEHMTETQITEILKAFGEGNRTPARFIDLLKDTTLFSKSIGLDHEGLTGRKILLEFDPISDYEKAVHNLAKESTANVEPVFVFTSKTSSVYSCLAEESGIKFFLSSISTSIPKSTSENTVLIPANNMSLILDATNKVLENSGDANVCFVFDILSELLTSVGQEKTYLFLQHALEMLSSKKTTALFLFNPSAHEPQVVSSLKNLFGNQLVYGKNGLDVVKTS
ncbi:MAG: MEDS domain-containing protein [Candidatus Bathyarchaeota archaeon]|nr:MAG: MEDS domain-containing protein [Candidatus Bathyarchaeota archaeon]